MKLGLALREVHRSELRLARSLAAIAARHHSDHGIQHVAVDLAVWSREHVALAAQAGRRYGVRMREHPRTAAVTDSAQAVKDQELLELTQRCHPQSLRQMRWANAMLKELSPQTLTS